MNTPNDRLAARGLTLPVPPGARASYVPVTRTGNLLYISGQISEKNGEIIAGCLGDGLDVNAGKAAAECAALNVLSQIMHTGGVPLEHVQKIVKIMVLVSSTNHFYEHHLVANGASDLLVDILGEAGRHARSAFGAVALPLNAAVEIEAIVEVSH